jgi:hypothetical protein
LGAGAAAVSDDQRDQRKSALPVVNSRNPGTHSQELKCDNVLSDRSSARTAKPTIAAISPNFRMQIT